MIVIREEQWRSLGAAPFEAFLQRMAESLRRTHPATVEDLAPREVLRRLRSAASRAESYGLASERDLEAFATLSFVVGPAFDAHPPFAEVLRGPLPPRYKLEQLFNGARAEDWEQASRVAPRGESPA